MSVEVKVEFSDLSGDSQAWEASGGKLREAGTAASALDLPNEAFMMAGYGFAQVYRSFLRKFETHVTGGSQESEQVAGVLEGAITGYREAEEAIIAKIRAVESDLDGKR